MALGRVAALAWLIASRTARAGPSRSTAGACCERMPMPSGVSSRALGDTDSKRLSDCRSGTCSPSHITRTTPCVSARLRR